MQFLNSKKPNLPNQHLKQFEINQFQNFSKLKKNLTNLRYCSKTSFSTSKIELKNIFFQLELQNTTLRKRLKNISSEYSVIAFWG